MSQEINRPAASILADKFPRIVRFLEVDPTGWISARLAFWNLWARDRLSPAELSAAYEEWADFYRWHLAQRADELAGDRPKRHMVEEWTDDMVYLFGRCAAYARGDDPGEWIPSWERRVEPTSVPGTRPGPVPDRQLVDAAAAR